MLRRFFTFLAPVLLATGLLVFAVPSGASTLSCASTQSCGGAALAYTAKGPLALSVLAPDPGTNGGFGYWNEPAGVNATGQTDGTQDFTVAQLAGEPAGLGGTFGHGEYAVIYTPGGQRPNDPILSSYDNTKPLVQAFCLSVEDVYRQVRRHLVQRWPSVLRPCDTIIGGPLQAGSPVLDFTGTTPAVVNPDPYQLWAPVEVAGQFLEFENIGLDQSSFYRHGYGGESFVLDDTALGGPGTQGLAYPENDQANQKWRIDGCTPPITVFNPAYYECATGPAPAPTVTVTVTPAT